MPWPLALNIDGMCATCLLRRLQLKLSSSVTGFSYGFLAPRVFQGDGDGVLASGALMNIVQLPWGSQNFKLALW